MYLDFYINNILIITLTTMHPSILIEFVSYNQTDILDLYLKIICIYILFVKHYLLNGID